MRARVWIPLWLWLLTSAACADKAPPALFPHPEPPQLAQPIPPPVPESPPTPVPACEPEPTPAPSGSPAPVPASEPRATARACETEPAP